MGDYLAGNKEARYGDQGQAAGYGGVIWDDGRRGLFLEGRKDGSLFMCGIARKGEVYVSD